MRVTFTSRGVITVAQFSLYEHIMRFTPDLHIVALSLWYSLPM